MADTTDLRASSFALGPLEHPNKMPFAGVLTWFNYASDRAVHGSNGLKVVIPTEIGAEALDSLVGMAVNYVEGAMNDHSPQDKIGVITEATLGQADSDGAVPVNVAGYIYAHDFGDAAISIKASQAALGFSYETAETVIEPGIWNGETVAMVKKLGYFTGASILYKNSAAYTNTSLAAAADNVVKEDELSVEAVQEVLEAIAALKEYVDAKFTLLSERQYRDEVVEQAQEYVDQAADAVVTAEDAVTDALEDAADESGVESVVDDANGGVVMAASSDEGDQDVVETQEDATALQAAADVESLRTELEATKAQLAELKAAQDVASAQRRSIAHPTSLLSKYDVTETGDETSLMASIDARTDLSVDERLALKFEMRDKARRATQ